MSTFAARLRGFGPVGILAILVVTAGNLLFAPLSPMLVVVWRSLSQTQWREIGYVRPRSWGRSIAIAAAAGAAFKLVMKILVMPLLGASDLNARYHDLVGNRAALAFMLLAVTVAAGWGEETFFRGFLFERLGKLLGSTAAARAGIILVTTALFAAAHYPDQRLGGAEQAIFTGLAFGIAYALSGSLFPVMVAHASFDVVAVFIIYSGAESTFAHLIFN